MITIIIIEKTNTNFQTDAYYIFIVNIVELVIVLYNFFINV